MTRSPLGGLDSFAGRVVAAVWLGIVAPTWPWGHVRLVGAALIVEGAFLDIVAPDGVVMHLSVLSTLVGEVLFVMSFAPSALADDDRF